MRRFLLLLAGVAVLPSRLGAGEPVDYLRDIKPVLKERCFACHGSLKQRAKLRLDAAALIREGGRHGPAVKPGDAGSLLVERITDPEESTRMPPQGKPLTEKQIALLKAWITAGRRLLPGKSRRKTRVATGPSGIPFARLCPKRRATLTVVTRSMPSSAPSVAGGVCG